MKKHFIFAALFLIFCAKPNQAQQPRWELFARGLYGVIAVDPTNSDVIYISPGVPGMWKTTDGGQSWNLYRNGWGLGRTQDILIDPTNPDMILAVGTPFTGVLKSINGGQTWVHSSNGLQSDKHVNIVSLAFDNRRRIFYLAHDGIFAGVLRSSDGVNWQSTNPFFNALSLTVDERTGVLYAAGFSGMWKSLDGGSNWIHISNGLRIGTIWHVVKLKQSNTLYAATHNGIYKSVDGGDNWFSVNDSITSKLSFRGGLVVAEKDTNTIYAGTEESVLDAVINGGIFVSRNGGDSWEQYNIGLPDTALDFSTQYIFLDNRSNVLYANIISLFGGSRGEGHVYRLRNAVITEVSERSQPIFLSSLTIHSYPNPFNSQTTLIWSVNKTGRVTLQISDILGKEVVTLLDEQRAPGEYRIFWNGMNAVGKRLPSGIYLARLQTGNEIKTIKLLLLQ